MLRIGFRDELRVTNHVRSSLAYLYQNPCRPNILSYYMISRDISKMGKIYQEFKDIIIIIILYFHYVTNFVLVILLPHVILITDFYSNKVMVSHKATCLSVYDCWDPLIIMLFNTMHVVSVLLHCDI